jgi:hypothetical protein
MVAGFKLTNSAEFTQTLPVDSQSGNPQQSLAAGKKGAKAISGLHPDPRKVIPLDDRDHSILNDF